MVRSLSFVGDQPAFLIQVFFFNWMIIALQCYGLCHTSICISHDYIHISFLLSLPPPFHPSRSSQSARLDSPCYRAASHWLSVLHMTGIYGNATFPICPTLRNWRRKWQPTPVFLPGKSHGQRSLGEGGWVWGWQKGLSK